MGTGSLLRVIWTLRGSHNLRPHYVHLHPVPHGAMLQEERGTDLEDDLGKRERKHKQGSQKEDVVLPHPPLETFAPSVPSVPISCQALLIVPSFSPPPSWFL